MRFLIIVKASPESEAGVMPSAERMAQMTTYNEALARAGVLLDAAGLKPSAAGWRIRYEGEQRRVIAGPFTEAKELIAGYTLIQARSREEALEWTRRFPNPHDEGVPAEIEVRPLYALEDLPHAKQVERSHALDPSA